MTAKTKTLDDIWFNFLQKNINKRKKMNKGKKIYTRIC